MPRLLSQHLLSRARQPGSRFPLNSDLFYEMLFLGLDDAVSVRGAGCPAKSLFVSIQSIFPLPPFIPSSYDIQSSYGFRRTQVGNLAFRGVGVDVLFGSNRLACLLDLTLGHGLSFASEG